MEPGLRSSVHAGATRALFSRRIPVIGLSEGYRFEFFRRGSLAIKESPTATTPRISRKFAATVPAATKLPTRNGYVLVTPPPLPLGSQIVLNRVGSGAPDRQPAPPQTVPLLRTSPRRPALHAPSSSPAAGFHAPGRPRSTRPSPSGSRALDRRRAPSGSRTLDRQRRRDYLTTEETPNPLRPCYHPETVSQ
jgi:hypothetical protein